ncbi:hypothetical protein FRC17_005505, partial [Serendipita sp. 399]
MNSNHDLIGNGRLPFELLGHAFRYYLEGESPLYPLETLLLVCKAWNEAALGHHSLWATYRINLGDEKYTNLWLRRLPIRLHRAGAWTPFHIDIYFVDLSTRRYGGFGYARDRIDVARSNTPPLLLLLAGESGVLCARWKSLRLIIDSDSIQFTAHELAALTYPMPSLTSLHLRIHAIASDQKLFPELPSVRTLFLRDCNMACLPDMSNAREIYLDNVLCANNNQARYGLRNAPHVQYLHINGNGSSIAHSRVCPNLRTLYLECGNVAPSLQQATMPRLENLFIDFSHVRVLEKVSEFQAIAQLRTIRLTGGDEARCNPQSGVRAISPLLQK